MKKIMAGGQSQNEVKWSEGRGAEEGSEREGMH